LLGHESPTSSYVLRSLFVIQNLSHSLLDLTLTKVQHARKTLILHCLLCSLFYYLTVNKIACYVDFSGPCLMLWRSMNVLSCVWHGYTLSAEATHSSMIMRKKSKGMSSAYSWWPGLLSSLSLRSVLQRLAMRPHKTLLFCS
jgi:hypothetical protein